MRRRAWYWIRTTQWAKLAKQWEWGRQRCAAGWAQLRAERGSQTSATSAALTPEHQRIQELNAPMERFFRSLKSEWVPPGGYLSSEQAVADVPVYVNQYYNHIRPHSANHYQTPEARERTAA